VDLLFASKMQSKEIQSELKNYVKALETNYTETIKELRFQNDRLVKKFKKNQGVKVNQTTEKNDLESLFVECIEDVRKDIMKRRLKNEIVTRKKNTITAPINDSDAKAFEESLIKLASLAKNKIKMSDFTSKDRFNVLDLFVNNEKTLIKIYEALFPHRV
jgi:hypothetical protein